MRKIHRDLSLAPPNKESQTSESVRHVRLAALSAALLLGISSVQAAPPEKASTVKGAAVVLSASSADTCDGAAVTRVIDHPLANGNPNAVILLTHNQGPSSGSGFVSVGPYAVFYDDADTCNNGGNRWVIVNMSPGGENITSTDRFNLLITTP